MLIDAGCKKKVYKENSSYLYDWVGSGKLLSKGACIEEDYRRYLAPDLEMTQVYTTIERQKVRAVYSKEETMSIDLTLSMKWLDPNIKTNYSLEDKNNSRVVIDTEKLDLIWKPDLFI